MTTGLPLGIASVDTPNRLSGNAELNPLDQADREVASTGELSGRRTVLADNLDHNRTRQFEPATTSTFDGELSFTLGSSGPQRADVQIARANRVTNG